MDKTFTEADIRAAFARIEAHAAAHPEAAAPASADLVLSYLEGTMQLLAPDLLPPVVAAAAPAAAAATAVEPAQADPAS